ncbi:hypothetical protein K461DRAFT_301855 [Myriangium duriaei CBS 260.36]|uniref:Uncharacterized protein n=1 Tax=Myriangium duriaei CBS 260.36 TaxID=1168546 RepID=A0A9P4MCK1_9PEZI|nr:hypothetical protein K461DRAFT_301855 [Myriangium duriaei CBS 260.36]
MDRLEIMGSGSSLPEAIGEYRSLQESPSHSSQLTATSLGPSQNLACTPRHGSPGYNSPSMNHRHETEYTGSYTSAYDRPDFVQGVSRPTAELISDTHSVRSRPRSLSTVHDTTASIPAERGERIYDPVGGTWTRKPLQRKPPTSSTIQSQQEPHRAEVQSLSQQVTQQTIQQGGSAQDRKRERERLLLDHSQPEAKRIRNSATCVDLMSTPSPKMYPRIIDLTSDSPEQVPHARRFSQGSAQSGYHEFMDLTAEPVPQVKLEHNGFFSRYNMQDSEKRWLSDSLGGSRRQSIAPSVADCKVSRSSPIPQAVQFVTAAGPLNSKRTLMEGGRMSSLRSFDKYGIDLTQPYAGLLQEGHKFSKRDDPKAKHQINLVQSRTRSYTEERILSRDESEGTSTLEDTRIRKAAETRLPHIAANKNDVSVVTTSRAPRGPYVEDCHSDDEDVVLLESRPIESPLFEPLEGSVDLQTESEREIEGDRIHRRQRSTHDSVQNLEVSVPEESAPIDTTPELDLGTSFLRRESPRLDASATAGKERQGQQKDILEQPSDPPVSAQKAETMAPSRLNVPQNALRNLDKTSNISSENQPAPVALTTTSREKDQPNHIPTTVVEISPTTKASPNIPKASRPSPPFECPKPVQGVQDLHVPKSTPKNVDVAAVASVPHIPESMRYDRPSAISVQARDKHLHAGASRNPVGHATKLGFTFEDVRDDGLGQREKRLLDAQNTIARHPQAPHGPLSMKEKVKLDKLQPDSEKPVSDQESGYLALGKDTEVKFDDVIMVQNVAITVGDYVIQCARRGSNAKNTQKSLTGFVKALDKTGKNRSWGSKKIRAFVKQQTGQDMPYCNTDAKKPSMSVKLQTPAVSGAEEDDPTGLNIDSSADENPTPRNAEELKRPQYGGKMPAADWKTKACILSGHWSQQSEDSIMSDASDAGIDEYEPVGESDGSPRSFHVYTVCKTVTKESEEVDEGDTEHEPFEVGDYMNFREANSVAQRAVLSGVGLAGGLVWSTDEDQRQTWTYKSHEEPYYIFKTWVKKTLKHDPGVVRPSHDAQRRPSVVFEVHEEVGIAPAEVPPSSSRSSSKISSCSSSTQGCATLEEIEAVFDLDEPMAEHVAEKVAEDAPELVVIQPDHLVDSALYATVEQANAAAVGYLLKEVVEPYAPKYVRLADTDVWIAKETAILRASQEWHDEMREPFHEVRTVKVPAEGGKLQERIVKVWVAAREIKGPLN